MFGPAGPVQLPGEAGRWPQDLKRDGQPLAATARNDVPVALLLPKDSGSLRLAIDGKPVERVPDADGRVWLQHSQAAAQESDALTVQTSRLIDDRIPMRVTTHDDIATSGKPRAIQLRIALLEGFVPESAGPQHLAHIDRRRLAQHLQHRLSCTGLHDPVRDGAAAGAPVQGTAGAATAGHCGSGEQYRPRAAGPCRGTRAGHGQ